MVQYGYITFKSVSYAMKFETALKNYDIKVRIIPVPRSISSSCGLCGRFNKIDIEYIKTIISNNKLEFEKIYTNFI